MSAGFKNTLRSEMNALCSSINITTTKFYSQQIKSNYSPGILKNPGYKATSSSNFKKNKANSNKSRANPMGNNRSYAAPKEISRPKKDRDFNHTF